MKSRKKKSPHLQIDDHCYNTSYMKSTTVQSFQKPNHWDFAPFLKFTFLLRYQRHNNAGSYKEPKMDASI